MHIMSNMRSANMSCFYPSRDRFPRILCHLVLGALFNHALLHYGRCFRLPEGLAVHSRLLAVLPGVDSASSPWLEQLRPRGPRHHLLCAVAPPFPRQRVLCDLPLHLLPAPAARAHDLLLCPEEKLSEIY